jgi:hypothetical protein
MLDKNDYYKVGGSLKANHPSYVVRRADEQLLYLLRKGEYCSVFNSRQMGKSSLKVRTLKLLRSEGNQCASIDLTLMGNCLSAQEWYRGFAYQIISSLDLDEIVNLDRWWKEQTLLTETQKLTHVFESIVFSNTSTNIIIFIDEIDSLIGLEFKNDFFAWIRACYNLRAEKEIWQRLRFCLLGVATPTELIEDKQRTPFNISRWVELTGFT